MAPGCDLCNDSKGAPGIIPRLFLLASRTAPPCVRDADSVRRMPFK